MTKQNKCPKCGGKLVENWEYPEGLSLICEDCHTNEAIYRWEQRQKKEKGLMADKLWHEEKEDLRKEAEENAEKND